MYFITYEKDLLGKEIAYNKLSAPMDIQIIITKDKCIFMVKQYEKGSRILLDYEIRAIFYYDEYDIVEDIISKGALTREEIENLKEECRKDIEAREDRIRKFEEEKEYQEYLRLKAKFEK